MHSKQRIQKIFYLPLEYQVFCHSSHLSTSPVFPYSILKRYGTAHRNNGRFSMSPDEKDMFTIQGTSTSADHNPEDYQRKRNPSSGVRQNLNQLSVVSSAQNMTLNRNTTPPDQMGESTKRKSVQDQGHTSESSSKKCSPSMKDNLNLNCNSSDVICIGSYPGSKRNANSEIICLGDMQSKNQTKDTSKLNEIKDFTCRGNEPKTNVTRSNPTIGHHTQSIPSCSNVNFNILMNISSLFQRHAANFSACLCDSNNTISAQQDLKAPLNTNPQLLKCLSQPNEVKVMSYNVLSQSLLLNHAYLYDHQDERYLDWEMRFKNIIMKIYEYSCDIVCLQEIEDSHLRFFARKLVKYKYVYKKRTGHNIDGCCIFYKESKYELVRSRLVEYFKSDDHNLLNKHNVGVIVDLKSKHHRIIVANTHLLYNPRRHDIRLEQCKYLLNQIKHMVTMSPNKNVPIVITGDFNSQPNSSLVYHVLNNDAFQFNSAYDLSSHFVSTFHESWCLVDYIFYTKNRLKLSGVKPLPKCNAKDFSRIPNHTEGSDHFSLVAKFIVDS